MASQDHTLNKLAVLLLALLAGVCPPNAFADSLPEKPAVEPTPSGSSEANGDENVVKAEVMFRYRSGFRWLDPDVRRPALKRPPPRPPRRRPATTRRSPPPKRKPSPPPSPPPPRLPPFEDRDELQVVCPMDVGSGFPQESKSCKGLIATVAVGEKAQQLRKLYNISTGNTAEVELAVAPGQRRRLVQATGLASAADTTEPTFDLLSVTFTNQALQKEIYQGVPINLRTVVFVLNLADCSDLMGWRNVPVSEVTKAVFNATAPFSNNPENYYSTCMYKKALFLPNNTVVVPQPINITCRGSIKWPIVDSWDSSRRCGVSEQCAWERQAEEQALALARRQNLRDLLRVLKWTERRRSIYILPPRTPCNWAGYGDVTCTGFTCSAFVRASSPTTLDFIDMHVLMHEAMHNFGLEHAAINIRGLPYDAVGDPSDVMGNFGSRKGLLCPSAPHLYRIGMATTIAGGNLTATDFFGTQEKRGYVLPAAYLSDQHMISVNLGRRTDKNKTLPDIPRVFLSYRVRNPNAYGFDSAIDGGTTHRVYVHFYDGLQDERIFGAKPQLVAVLQAQPGASLWRSETWRYDSGDDLGGGLAVHLKKASDREAEVDLCRFTSWSETDCFDGADNDCDGLVDEEDDDCQ